MRAPASPWTPPTRAASTAARAAIEAALVGKVHGEAGQTILLEEFLEGPEASVFAVTDGRTVLPLAPARDHKRVGDGDTGP
ncbi:MAG TPA: hypothetical protein VFC13_20305, partial [Actinomycetes bacterium]|nr:hypothetical protein [Actinomycetes bacterium]